MVKSGDFETPDKWLLEAMKVANTKEQVKQELNAHQEEKKLRKKIK